MKAYAQVGVKTMINHDFLPQGQRFCIFFVPRVWGTCLFKKFPRVGPGGMVRLGIVELTDALRKLVFLNPKTPLESSYYLYVTRLIGKQLVYDQCLNCTQRA